MLLPEMRMVEPLAAAFSATALFAIVERSMLTVVLAAERLMALPRLPEMIDLVTLTNTLLSGSDRPSAVEPGHTDKAATTPSTRPPPTYGSPSVPTFARNYGISGSPQARQPNVGTESRWAWPCPSAERPEPSPRWCPHCAPYGR